MRGEVGGGLFWRSVPPCRPTAGAVAWCASYFVVTYKPSAPTYRKHVMCLLSTIVMRCHCTYANCTDTKKRVLLSNGCFWGSAVLVWSKYAAISIYHLCEVHEVSEIMFVCLFTCFIPVTLLHLPSGLSSSKLIMLIMICLIIILWRGSAWYPKVVKRIRLYLALWICNKCWMNWILIYRLIF
jgi:hypothetical protein